MVRKRPTIRQQHRAKQLLRKQGANKAASLLTAAKQGKGKK